MLLQWVALGINIPELFAFANPTSLSVEIIGSLITFVSPAQIPISFISLKIPSTSWLQYFSVILIPTPISTTSVGTLIEFKLYARVASKTVAEPWTHIKSVFNNFA